MSRLRGLLGLAALGLLPAGCGTDRVSGSSSETENMVAARRFPVDSLVAGRDGTGAGEAVGIIRLDAGNFDFRASSASGEDLSVERRDGRLLPFGLTVWDSAGGRGRIQVRLDSALLARKDTIVLRWGLSLLRRAAPSAVWAGIPETRILVDNSVLVDDFEGPSLRTPLPDSGWWYSFAGDTLTTVGAPAAVAADGGRAGHALRVSYVPASEGAKYVYVGVALGKACFFRSLDSMVFWARGTGSLITAFDKLTGATGKAIVKHALDTSWTRIRIRPQDLDSANGIGGNVGWAAVRDSVTNLTFFASGGKDLWLDDIRFYGVNRDDLK